MYKIILTDEFESNLIDILNYYFSIDIDFAISFEKELVKVSDSIRSLPEMYQLRYDNIRRVNLKSFPFCIFYKIVGEEIYLMDVLHQSRDPKTWP